MKILILILVLILSINLFGAIDGLGLKDDNYAHIFAGAWISEVFKRDGWSEQEAFFWVLTASFCKEMYDGKISAEDISFTMSGWLLSYLFSFINLEPKKEVLNND